jgi:hypothetical protein
LSSPLGDFRHDLTHIHGCFACSALTDSSSELVYSNCPRGTACLSPGFRTGRIVYTANDSIGPGGSTNFDSPHFRVYGDSSDDAQDALGKLEAAFECFVRDLNFYSTGLSFNDDTDVSSWTKTNIYSVSELPNAAGVMHSDTTTGMGYVEVQQTYLAASEVTVHEWGHALHYHQRTWVD